MYVYQEKFFFLTCEKNERNDRIFSIDHFLRKCLIIVLQKYNLYVFRISFFKLLNNDDIKCKSSTINYRNHV